MPYGQVVPVVDPSVRTFCAKPYPNHKHGCPNFNHKSSCPPKAPLLHRTLDLTKPVFAIYNIFDLAAHVTHMRQRCPTWSERQLRCCLYWQPRARKQLTQEIDTFLRGHVDLDHPIVVRCPEAQGVNVTLTMAQIGIQLPWPPVDRAYQVALVGTWAKAHPSVLVQEGASHPSTAFQERPLP